MNPPTSGTPQTHHRPTHETRPTEQLGDRPTGPSRPSHGAVPQGAAAPSHGHPNEASRNRSTKDSGTGGGTRPTNPARTLNGTTDGTTDGTTRPKIGAAAFLVTVGNYAIFAGLLAVSYGHAFSFATNAGAEDWEAYIIAATVDGLIIMALGAIQVARHLNRKIPWQARTALIAGIIATLGVNIDHGLAYDVPGVIVAIWIVFTLEGAYQIGSWLTSAIGAHHRTVDSSRGASQVSSHSSVETPVLTVPRDAVETAPVAVPQAVPSPPAMVWVGRAADRPTLPLVARPKPVTAARPTVVPDARPEPSADRPNEATGERPKPPARKPAPRPTERPKAVAAKRPTAVPDEIGIDIPDFVPEDWDPRKRIVVAAFEEARSSGVTVSLGQLAARTSVPKSTVDRYVKEWLASPPEGAEQSAA